MPSRAQPILSRENDDAYVLADAQFVIAREHGFESWPGFATHVEALTYQDASVARFEAAADAVVTGDVVTLQRLRQIDNIDFPSGNEAIDEVLACGRT